jgi:putative DNA primase/helicase
LDQQPKGQVARNEYSKMPRDHDSTFQGEEPGKLEACGLDVAAQTHDRSGICCGSESEKNEQEQPCSGVAAGEGVGGETDKGYPLIPQWQQPVDGAALLDELTVAFQKHLVMSDGAAEAAALWCVLAQAHDCFQHSPILAFNSPVYGCGKTRGLRIVNNLTRSKLFSHVTPASIFRFIEKHPGVGLLFDDGEGYIRADNRDMMSILDSGHGRAGASVLRCDGDKHDPKDFPTWTPKAIGKVGDLPPSLKTRSIVIKMKRKRKDEHVADLTQADEKRLKKELARKIVRWVWDHRAELRRSEPEIPSSLYNRARDNWKPLLAIAALAGGEWPDRARRAANLLNGSKEDTTEGVMLLADCRVAFGDKDRVSSQGLCAALNRLESRPWGDMRYGQGIDPKGLAKGLAPFDIEAKSVRVDDKVLRGLERVQFEDAWARY